MSLLRVLETSPLCNCDVIDIIHKSGQSIQHLLPCQNTSCVYFLFYLCWLVSCVWSIAKQFNVTNGLYLSSASPRLSCWRNILISSKTVIELSFEAEKCFMPLAYCCSSFQSVHEISICYCGILKSHIVIKFWGLPVMTWRWADYNLWSEGHR